MLSRKKLIVLAVTLISLGIITGMVLSSSIGIHTKAYSQEYKIPQESIDFLTKLGNATADVAQAVRPTVVNISTTRTVKTPGIQNPFLEDPFFRRFFGDRGLEQPRERKAMSLGSGVIIDKNGMILTNNHVVKGAEEIKVILADQREFKGKVVGTDAKTDLALVKIEAKGLPAVKWGDSTKLRVGDPVLAIGNPYGLNQTVTQGIVSAVGRANVGISDYEDFIQTDAAINPGNSGGALVNARGELVGINTAIFSTTGGYQGIGFAIPSSMARLVMESLMKTGKVTRGWLGIWIQPLTPELAKKFGLKEDQKGALVSDVVEGAPAEKAGIKGGDFITKFNGHEVEDPNSLRNMVAGTAPGTEATITFIRDGKTMTAKTTITEQPAEEISRQPSKFNNALNGVHVQDITPDIRQSLELPQRVQGVVVAEIDEDSPAADALASGDVLMEINRVKIKNVKDYSKVVSQIGPESSILIQVFRDGKTFYLTLSTR
jgi:serine protease Do